MKKLISLLLSVAVSILTCVTAFAAVPARNNDQVAPCYEITRETVVTLTISGTSGKCESLVKGYSDVSQIVIEQTLQKQGLFWIWSDVDGASWTKTFYSSAAKVTNTKSGLDSGTYRLKTVFKLTASDGTTETITAYSDESNI